MMREQDRLIKHISLTKFKDPRIVQSIAYHPILFAKHIMADPDDYRPVRIRYFGAFVGKFMHNKEMYTKLSYIITALKVHPDLYKIFIDPTFANDFEARVYVNQLFDANEKQAILDIYDAVTKAITNK